MMTVNAPVQNRPVLMRLMSAAVVVVALGGVFFLGACGAGMYAEQRRALEEDSAKLPYVANGFVDRDTVVMSRMTGHGSFSPPRPTENFPRIWGDVEIPQQQQTVFAAQQGYSALPAYVPPPARPANRMKLAVMEIEDLSNKVGRDAAARGTDYLRATLNATRGFIVIDKTRQAEALLSVVSRERTESYRECYDQACQIPLGQALAADTILRTQITTIANFCTLSAELVDLEKEAAVGGGLVKFDCTEDGLSMAVEKLVPQITTGY